MEDCEKCGEQETFNVWTDWRGNPYTVGTLILYARMDGRSCEMAEGVVVDIYEVYYDKGKWNPLKPGEEAPLHDIWGWVNPETREASAKYHGEPWKRERVTVPCEVERRAKIMPTNRTSRFGGYYNRKWVIDDGTGKSGFIDTEQKPITLKVTESITVPLP